MNRWTIQFFIGALLGPCLFLSGCARTEWAVKFADTYISWKLIDYFDFKGEDKAKVKAQSTEFIQTLRESKFPVLASTFSKSAAELSELDFRSESELKLWVGEKMEESELFLESLSQEAAPFALKVGALIEKENWQNFLKQFEKENDKILKKKSKCESRFEDHLEDWLSNLNEAQEEAVKNYCELIENSQIARVKNRQFLLENFRKSAEPKGEFNKAAFLISLKPWVQSYRKLQNPETRQRWQTNKENLKRMFTLILAHSTEAQRQHFIQELSQKAQIFQKLSL